jgi:hypothetical protein
VLSFTGDRLSAFLSRKFLGVENENANQHSRRDAAKAEPRSRLASVHSNEAS